MWFVYILKCSDNSFYVGITNDLQKRIEKHQKGKGAKYTKGRRPVVLQGFFVVSNKSIALKEEHRIKQLSRADKILLICSLNEQNNQKLS